MRTIAISLTAALALAACQQPAEPADAPAATAAADPQPSEMMRQTFSSCEWGKEIGRAHV